MKAILFLSLFVLSFSTHAQTKDNQPPKQLNPKDVPTTTTKGKNTPAQEDASSQIVIEPEPDEESDEVFVSYREVMPRFPGCEDIDGNDADKKNCADKKLLAYIYNNLTYPKGDLCAEGMAVVSFKITKEGNLEDIKIIRSLGEAFDVEIMKLMNKMVQENGPWTPGIQRGKAVEVRYNLPIRYKL